MRPSSIRCVTALGVVALLSGCSTGLESLPLSAPASTDGSYSLTAVFDNALNLPTQAKVKLDGVDIGAVETIAAQDFTARVTMRIRDDVPLSPGVGAELRSATPLGDLFIAIHPDPNRTDEAPLRDGDTIPLKSTVAGATVEELLSSAAVLVNGGVVRNLTTLLNGAGKAVGGRGSNVATLLRESSELITRLNGRSAQIKTALDSTSALTATMAQRQNTLDETLTAAAPAITTIAENRDRITDLVDTVARITHQLQRFPSLRGDDGPSVIAQLNELSAAFNAVTLDPTLSLNALNRLIPIIMKLTAGTNLHGAGDVTQLAFGSLPDLNYPGDPQFHGPDGTDYHAAIGSLRYEWNLLLNKIYGPNR